MTLITELRAGRLPDAVQAAAAAEGVEAGALADKVLTGRAVVLTACAEGRTRPVAVGESLRTKVNANFGTSPHKIDVAFELAKLEAACAAGADAVMDLSTGGDLDAVRKEVLARSPVPVGTVPIYQAAAGAAQLRGEVLDMTAEELFAAIERHLADGVHFVTVHCGVSREVARLLAVRPRVLGVVSRGGALLLGWMARNERENPLLEGYDRLLDIAARYDAVLSLGDGLRPGCLADATDGPQMKELSLLGQLQKRALSHGVQSIIEGPGHLPLNQVGLNVRLQKDLCGGAPFYVLGPLVTDVAPGYDHIVAAIGGAVAGAAGADFLCYVTPREHLGLPEESHVREGVVAARIAAHAADVAKGLSGAQDWDRQMAEARRALDWERQRALAIDPAAARSEEGGPGQGQACTMCGEYCPLQIAGETLGVAHLERCSVS